MAANCSGDATDDGLKIGNGFFSGDATVFGLLPDRLCERMLAAGLKRSSKPDCLIGRHRGTRFNGGYDGVAGCQRTRLVKNDLCDARGAFQRCGIPHQNAKPGGNACACENCCRRCESQRTGTGNHKDGNRVDQRLFRAFINKDPAKKRQNGDNQDDWNENGADPVDQFLDRCFRRLGAFDEANNAGERGFCANRARFNNQETIKIDCAADDRIAFDAGNGQALTCHHGLVNARSAFNNDPIDRDRLARTHHHHIADPDRVESDHCFNAIPNASGLRRAEPSQSGDCRCGFGRGALFKPFAEQDEGNHNRCRLELEMDRVMLKVGDLPDVEAETVGCSRPECDQKIHRRHAGT